MIFPCHLKELFAYVLPIFHTLGFRKTLLNCYNETIQGKDMEFFERQMVLLDSLLRADKPVIGSVLSKQCSLSLKTIKKEIDDMNDYLCHVGFRIVSKTGSGYEVEVLDSQKYETFKQQAINRFQRNQFFKDHQLERVHFIIRQLLSNRGNIYIEDLAQGCYVSASIINRDMRLVHQKLAEYNLQLKNKTKKGLVLQGDEWDKRLALIAEHRIYRRFILNNYDVDEYDFRKLFLTDSNGYNQAYHILREALNNEEGYLLPYYALPKIVYMIILSVTRQHFDDDLMKTAARFDFVKQGTSYFLAQRIYQHLSEELDVFYSPIAVSTLAAYLRSFRIIKYSRFEDFTNAQQIKDTVTEFLEFFNTFIDLSEYDLNQVFKDLCCAFASLLSRLVIGVHPDEYQIARVRNDGLLGADYCLILYLFLKQKGYDVQVLDTLEFYYLFMAFARLEAGPAKRKILVVSRNGYYYAKDLCAKFERSMEIEDFAFEPREYLELKSLNLNDYQMIATDIDELGAEYNLPAMPVYYWRTRQELNWFIDNLRKLDRDHQPLLLHPSNLILVEKTCSQSSFEQLLYQSLPLSEQQKQAFLTEVNLRSSLLSPVRKNQLLIQKGLRDVVGVDFIRVFIFVKPFKYGDGQVKTAVVYNIKDNQMQKLRMVSRMITKLLHHPELFTVDDPELYYELLYKMELE